MLEEIELKIEEMVRTILNKPAGELTKSDYEILTSECFRLHHRIDSEVQNKRMAEMLTTIWTK